LSGCSDIDKDNRVLVDNMFLLKIWQAFYT